MEEGGRKVKIGEKTREDISDRKKKEKKEGERR